MNWRSRMSMSRRKKLQKRQKTMHHRCIERILSESCYEDCGKMHCPAMPDK